MYNAKVWVNGQFVGNRPYGYIGFRYDISEFLNFDQENTIAVRLTPEDLSSRWYPGAGLYRNVWIEYDNKIHFTHWGTFITTPNVDEKKASVNVVSTITNTSDSVKNRVLEYSVVDPNGEEVFTDQQDAQLEFGENKITIQFELASPMMWDIENPNLYVLQAKILERGKETDVSKTRFGIRTLKFTRDNGFFLNGKRTQIKGVCLHHDNGPLGAVVNKRAIERKLQIMKNMGVNAIRTSHNPPSPELLDLCDEMGFLVQVEAFDVWRIAKVPNGYNKFFDDWSERDIKDLVRRDRNHPSVFMWSIGNEILEQRERDGWQEAKRLNDFVKELDTTRPTTAGFNYYPHPFKNKLAYQIDIVGMNYRPLKYGEILQTNPEVIVYGSETSSMTSSRGVYHLPIDHLPLKESGHVSSYDVIHGPAWAYPPDAEWDALAASPESLGEFIWTGIDYLGEPTPYGGRDNSTKGYWNDDWPSRSSYFAPVDLAGLPKDRYYLYQSQWTDEPMVHVLPHWNWQGKEGDSIPVFVYTNCEEVELLLNGRSLGRKVKGKDLTEIPAEFWGFPGTMYKSKYRLSWMVAYEPGALKAIAYKNGVAKAEKEIKTAGEPVKVVMAADRTKISADGKDLSYITVWVEDASGNPCPLAYNKIDFGVEGVGSIAGVGNGNQRSLESFQAPHRKLFRGKCVLIVKSVEQAGQIKIKASSEGLQSDHITIISK